MNMVKNIGSKIDEKIKSGELKESELMEEGMDLLNKMKNMPGMGDMQKMFEKMGIPGLGKGGKINMGAMEAQLNKNMKTAQMKERIRAKAAANALAKAASQIQSTQTNQPSISEEELLKIFSTGEKVEKTPRGAKPLPSKKKKGKK
jgi:spore coat protein CotH